MANVDLTKYGITGTTEIVHNPSYETLFEEETKAGLEGYEVGKETELGAVNVMTGIYTGRSPKDKYIVVDENSKDTVWWTSGGKYPNKPWAACKILINSPGSLLRSAHIACSSATFVLGKCISFMAYLLFSVSIYIPITSLRSM